MRELPSPREMSNTNTSPHRKRSTWFTLKTAIIGGIERGFQSYGETVARKPWYFILACVLLTALSGLGLFRFRAENEGIKLWIPRNSDFRINNDWLFEKFPRSSRFNSIILTADNILEPSVIQAMWKIRKGVANIRNSNGDTWEKMCMKRPVIRPPSLEDFGKRKRRQVEDDWDDWEDDDEDFFVDDPSDFISLVPYPTPYCNIIGLIPTTCFETSILELWANDGKYDQASEEAIMNLTRTAVLEKINSVNISGLFLMETNFTSYLSGVERNDDGRIVSATATVMRWFGDMNMTAAKETGGVPGRGEPLDPRMLEFEGDLVKVLNNDSFYPPGVEGAPNVARSFGDIAGDTILGDIGFFAIGYIMMFLYASYMLGKFNCVEQRILLASAGIVGVIMGIIVSYGLCSAFGLFYGPMHSVMPFLMLGIGIDDMFVIMQSWDTLKAEDRSRGLVERFGVTMRHAGAAITVTSITDIIAFGIGGLTVLPALQSFCIYASVGIVATFIFQSTFFLAWFSLDQRRQESGRNACCCCFVHTNYQPPSSSDTQQGCMARAFRAVGNILTKRGSKIIVILITLVLLSVGIWGNILLKQEFDPTWFIPQETYLAKWFRLNKQYFPSQGEVGTIYFNGVKLPQDIGKIESLAAELRKKTDIIETVDSWTQHYQQFVKNNSLVDPLTDISQINQTLFRETFVRFLFSPSGAVYRTKFRFASDLVCGELSPDIDLFEISFTHRLFSGPEEHVPAMNQVKDAIKNSNITGRVFPWAYLYSAWETDEVISLEVYRNIALAVVAVFFTTLFFICNFRGAVIIIFCVLLTLVDVGGFLHFWGITIDTVSCNNLVIAIGLCVDYSVHITHRFLYEEGTHNERTVATVQNIGPAVFNGGFSTFLAFILLAGSRSHVFSSFFKIFFLVVTFGLFHGLIFLPVILSLIGPSSYFTKATVKSTLEVTQQTQI